MNKHIFLYTDDPGVGGVAQYNKSIIYGLVNLGYQVTCVQSSLSDQLIIDKEHLISQPYALLKTNSLEELKQTLINTSVRPTIIICSNSNPFSNFTTKQIAIQLKIPYINPLLSLSEYNE